MEVVPDTDLGIFKMAGFFDYLYGNKRKESDGNIKKDSLKSPGIDNPLKSFLLDIDHFEENRFKSNQKTADAGDAEAQKKTMQKRDYIMQWHLCRAIPLPHII